MPNIQKEFVGFRFSVLVTIIASFGGMNAKAQDSEAQFFGGNQYSFQGIESQAQEYEPSVAQKSPEWKLSQIRIGLPAEFIDRKDQDEVRGKLEGVFLFDQGEMLNRRYLGQFFSKFRAHCELNLTESGFLDPKWFLFISEFMEMDLRFSGQNSFDGRIQKVIYTGEVLAHGILRQESEFGIFGATTQFSTRDTKQVGINGPVRFQARLECQTSPKFFFGGAELTEHSVMQILGSYLQK